MDYSVNYQTLQPKFKDCTFDSDKKPEYLRTWLRLLSGIVRNTPHGKQLETPPATATTAISLVTTKQNATRRPGTSSTKVALLKRTNLKVAVAVAVVPPRVVVAVVVEAHPVLPPTKSSKIQLTRTRKTRARP